MLAARHTPSEALAALQQHHAALSSAQIGNLNHAFEFWAVQALRRRSSDDELPALADAMYIAAQLVLEGNGEPEASEKALAHSWLGQRAWLQASMRINEAQESTPAEPTAQMRELLAEIGKDKLVYQDSLAAKFGLTHGRISQLLTHMELAGWIEREKVGRRKRVRLAAQAADAALTEPPPPKLSPADQAWVDGPLASIMGTRTKIGLPA